MKPKRDFNRANENQNKRASIKHRYRKTEMPNISSIFQREELLDRANRARNNPLRKQETIKETDSHAFSVKDRNNSHMDEF